MKSSRLSLIFCLIILASACSEKEDEEPMACAIDAETIQDIDGNCYKIVLIGEQWWMAENLRTSKKRDGSSIREANSVTKWTSASASGVDNSKYTYFDNNPQNNETYGKLYNGEAICCDICPSGWKVPASSDWGILFTSLNELGLDGSNMKLKSAWSESEFTGDNESGFSAYPSGSVSGGGDFFDGYAVWWTSEVDLLGISYIYFLADLSSTIIGTNSFDGNEGNSVRCVKE